MLGLYAGTRQVDTKCFMPIFPVFLNERMKCPGLRRSIVAGSQYYFVSADRLIEQEEAKAGEKTWNELTVGQIREGTVRSIMPYGAFVDLGGVDGLLHVSAMSHTRVTDPKKIVNEGDKVQVMVLGVDKEKKKVSLGLKQLSKDPWANVTTDFAVGTTVTGTVKKLMDFGAFVELAPGVEGLVHISQVAASGIGKVAEVLKKARAFRPKCLILIWKRSGFRFPLPMPNATPAQPRHPQPPHNTRRPYRTGIIECRPKEPLLRLPSRAKPPRHRLNPPSQCVKHRSRAV